MLIQVQVSPGKMSSVKPAMLKAFQDEFCWLLNKANPINRPTIVNAVCVHRRKGTPQRQGKILIGIPGTNSLFVDYQYSDNDSCYQYRVIVPHSWIKPEELRQKLIHTLENTTAAVKVEPPLPQKLTKPIVPAFVSQSSASPEQALSVASNHQKKDTNLKGFTKDPDSVEILLMDLREIAKGGIVTRGLVLGYLTPMARNAYSASQSFRRIVEAGILVHVEGARYKLRTESKNEVTLATRVMELKIQFEKFEVVSESIKQVENKIGMLNQRKLIIEEEMVKINEELKREEIALEEICSQVAPGSTLAIAHKAFLEIQNALK